MPRQEDEDEDAVLLQLHEEEGTRDELEKVLRRDPMVGKGFLIGFGGLPLSMFTVPFLMANEINLVSEGSPLKREVPLKRKVGFPVTVRALSLMSMATGRVRRTRKNEWSRWGGGGAAIERQGGGKRK